MSNPKILFVGPLSDFSGYAAVARGYAEALHYTNPNIVTRDLNYDGAKREKNYFERTLADKDTQGVDIVFQHTTPNEMFPKQGCFNVGAFCWETDRIPEPWVEQLNKMQLVLVPIDANLEAARRCGVYVPIEKVPYAFNTKKYGEQAVPFHVPGRENAFKILAVCQYSKKKGIDPLLKAYLSEFRPEDNTLLILKTYFGPNDGEAETKKMAQIIQVIKNALRLEQYPEIQLIHSVMGFTDVRRLYATSDLYCLPSRGEGWGVPHFDALGYGLPAIATKGTGPAEFITPDTGWLVESNKAPCVDMPHPHSFMYTAKDNWREPVVSDLMRCMREAHATWSKRKYDATWDKMKVNAALSIKAYDVKKIGPQLNDTIMKYYNMWRDSNGH